MVGLQFNTNIIRIQKHNIHPKKKLHTGFVIINLYLLLISVFSKKLSAILEIFKNFMTESW